MDRARILQGKLRLPSSSDFKDYVANNLLINCPCTIDDVSQAEAIYGPLEPLLMGKMVLQHPAHYSNILRIPLLPYIYIRSPPCGRP